MFSNYELSLRSRATHQQPTSFLCSHCFIRWKRTPGSLKVFYRSNPLQLFDRRYRRSEGKGTQPYLKEEYGSSSD
ncbi:hypothetical protein MPTK1_5g07710 [Marchantia polymorpha subsp. ruderalis]|uniref:Uncharacterized protein n=2 Tax=Marchantia polymorpha TaxID=3197 RepID=A0AAF6BG02_MARPO|nr:hypothetical protein MARPO_0127s0013 [Marchantia polymorpha]BBN10936.1 hypothetical protein Mp_5g07710 [Marchantia polymorpha subsp. ruderalis]|eukprot:PTQ30226.1 hypothetical protein MARPO_0127s0013 [Marchantia polymorpha]